MQRGLQQRIQSLPVDVAGLRKMKAVTRTIVGMLLMRLSQVFAFSPGGVGYAYVCACLRAYSPASVLKEIHGVA